MNNNYNIDYLRHTPKEERYTSYEILYKDNIVYISTNNYIMAKKALSLFGEPFYTSTDMGDNILEIIWKVSLDERKKLTKIGLNTNALGRKKKRQNNNIFNQN